MHVVLVEGAVPDGRNEAFPDARLLARIKTVRVLVPPIEFADHAHRVGVGRPGGEVGALGIMRKVRPELVEQVAVSPFVEEMQVERAQQGASYHAGTTRSRMPRSGMRTQSGRLFSS